MPVLLFSFFVSAAAGAAAGDSTLSAGYAGIQTGKYLDGISSRHRLAEGVNIKYRYDMDDVWGLIGSVSYARHHDYQSLVGGTDYADFSVDRANIRLEYLSLQAGPVYRFNEFFSGYLMTGLTTTKYEGSGRVDAFYHPDGASEREASWYERDSERKTNIAYSAGLQFNPMEELAIDVSFEGSGFNSWKTSGINVGIGYRF